MPLSSGARLGAYEIIGPLGAGGMGEVYRALDSSLGREVAIKVLPEAVAHHPERLARFEREARLLASLSHPNIAVVHGLERIGRQLLPGDGAGEGRDASRAERPRRDPAPGNAGHLQTDRRRTRGGARAVHHSSGPEAGEHHGHAERHGEDSRFRTGQGGLARRQWLPEPVTHAQQLADDGGGRDGNSGLHEPRAGAWAIRSIGGPTSGRSDACCTKLSPASARFPGARPPTRLPRSSGRSRTGPRWPRSRR